MDQKIKIDEIQFSQIEKVEGSLAYIQAVLHGIKKSKEYAINDKSSDIEKIKHEVLGINRIMNEWVKKEGE